MSSMTPSPKTPNALTKETHGVDTIPLRERSYRPYHIVMTMYGSNLSYSAILFGAFPILFGLSWWASVTSVLAGCFIGGLVLAPMGLFGPKTGTNNPVSSGAHFGVAGRFIGTALALFSALGFISLTVWTSGDALSTSINRFADTGSDTAQRVLGYAVIAALVLFVCIRGIHLVIKVQERIMAPLMSLVLLAGVFAFAPRFDAGYAGGDLAFGSFGITWLASTLLIAGLLVSYAGFVGDWARYIHPDTPAKNLLGATFFSGMVTCVPILWGAFIASTFPADSGDFVGSLVANSPGWFVIGLIMLALVAGVAQGAIGLYGTGLDTSSLIPRLSRAQATLLISAVSTVLVYLGAFVWDALAVVSAFLVVLLIVTGPWAAILAVGYLHSRGHYYPGDLQVFTHGKKGGRYWFTHGWNWRAVVAWLVGSVVGLLFGAAPPIFTGPFVNVAGGADISFGVAIIVGAVLYVAFLHLSPMPTHVFGPEGPAFGKENKNAHLEALTGSAMAGITAPEEEPAPEAETPPATAFADASPSVVQK
ncbi:cytosine permease [uncultured Kocuria sp.]|uniref:purine-cytosine permease family protein n=1 Tax=uncultured Kocuria sp. TaxID=259305 RepID=UPI002602D167|nr:cytosine permease [uncultured Kocuria sp.]